MINNQNIVKNQEIDEKINFVFNFENNVLYKKLLQKNNLVKDDFLFINKYKKNHSDLASYLLINKKLNEDINQVLKWIDEKILKTKTFNTNVIESEINNRQVILMSNSQQMSLGDFITDDEWNGMIKSYNWRIRNNIYSFKAWRSIFKVAFDEAFLTSGQWLSDAMSGINTGNDFVDQSATIIAGVGEIIKAINNYGNNTVLKFVDGVINSLENIGSAFHKGKYDIDVIDNIVKKSYDNICNLDFGINIWTKFTIKWDVRKFRNYITELYLKATKLKMEYDNKNDWGTLPNICY
ncbi:hypothetical protein [Mycoplasma crocodyli]|uniref:Uncharacterized protein n=1 Tax=Mycoplasma crocodyli (strain ATCC 51981 / MP145) TaxID=512564 RepID=D5E5R4_MYCCM|nr:hypothetical protein [Mycoplasma crocodyli]ADE19364.1 hypothetical protein MCRO_0482 [Mycoplasma crocodyli MP145]